MQNVLEGYATAATADFIAAYDGLSPESIDEHVSAGGGTFALSLASAGEGTLERCAGL